MESESTNLESPHIVAEEGMKNRIQNDSEPNIPTFFSGAKIM